MAALDYIRLTLLNRVGLGSIDRVLLRNLHLVTLRSFSKCARVLWPLEISWFRRFCLILILACLSFFITWKLSCCWRPRIFFCLSILLSAIYALNRIETRRFGCLGLSFILLSLFLNLIEVFLEEWSVLRTSYASQRRGNLYRLNSFQVKLMTCIDQMDDVDTDLLTMLFFKVVRGLSQFSP